MTEDDRKDAEKLLDFMLKGALEAPKGSGCVVVVHVDTQRLERNSAPVEQMREFLNTPHNFSCNKAPGTKELDEILAKGRCPILLFRQDGDYVFFKSLMSVNTKEGPRCPPRSKCSPRSTRRSTSRT